MQMVSSIQGNFSWLLSNDGSAVKVDAQIMDCELSYNSGMAC